MILEFPSLVGFDMVIPPACLGTYRRQLLISSIWPLIAMLAVVAYYVCWELARRRLNTSPHTKVCSIGLQRALPVIISATFVLTPSRATKIFKAFLCDKIEYDWTGHSRRYMQDDLRTACSSDEYEQTRAIAVMMLIVWPVAVPAVYALLLWASREAILSSRPTTLSRATSFLWADYKILSEAFWWEPVEMCRKLTLTGARIRLLTNATHFTPLTTLCHDRHSPLGWVMVISEDYEQLRVLVALVVSISHLTLHLIIKPLRRYAIFAFVMLSNPPSCQIDGTLADLKMAYSWY